MHRIRAVIVDDEESARDVLENLLLLFCEEVEVLAKCANIPMAVEEIKKHEPDLVFLDIEMPKYAGYEIVNFFDAIHFQMIFVTAYDQYAVKAFEVAAIDYLLKPVKIERLQAAVERVRQRKNLEGQQQKLSVLKTAMESKEIKSMLVFDKAQQNVVQFDSIIAIEAQESYCIIHCIDQQFVVSKNLSHFEKTLEGNVDFFRSHRSWIVNKKHISKYSKTNLNIYLSNNMETKLSKYRKVEFEEFLLS